MRLDKIFGDVSATIRDGLLHYSGTRNSKGDSYRIKDKKSHLVVKRKLISQKIKNCTKNVEFSSKKYGDNWNRIDTLDSMNMRKSNQFDCIELFSP